MKKNRIMSLDSIFREQAEPRRKQEHADSEMLSKSMTSVANLPQKPIHRLFNQDMFVEHLANPANEK